MNSYPAPMWPGDSDSRKLARRHLITIAPELTYQQLSDLVADADNPIGEVHATQAEREDWLNCRERQVLIMEMAYKRIVEDSSC